MLLVPREQTMTLLVFVCLHLYVVNIGKTQFSIKNIYRNIPIRYLFRPHCRSNSLFAVNSAFTQHLVIERAQFRSLIVGWRLSKGAKELLTIQHGENFVNIL